MKPSLLRVSALCFVCSLAFSYIFNFVQKSYLVEWTTVERLSLRLITTIIFFGAVALLIKKKWPSLIYKP